MKKHNYKYLKWAGSYLSKDQVCVRKNMWKGINVMCMWFLVLDFRGCRNENISKNFIQI